MRNAIIVIFIILMSAITLQAQDASTSLHYALETIDDLEVRGVLSASEAETQRNYYLSQAENFANHNDTLSPQAIEAQFFEDTNDNWWRFISFVNIIWVFASIIIVLSVSMIFITYVVPILKEIPVIIYEIILYIACFTFIWGGQYVSSTVAQFVALPGILGLAFLLPFSYGRRQFKSKSSRKSATYEDHKLPIILQNLVLMLIWGACAIIYESQLIGFLTIAVLVATVTATRAVPAILSSIGIKDHNIGHELMGTSFLLLLTYIVMEVQEIVGIYWVFEIGVHWIGAYGYFTALEWMASRWRKKTSLNRYIFWQIFAIVSGVVAIFMGQFFSIEALTETGGTFLLIYVLTKYFEIPKWRKYWIWASLGLGLLLYVLALIINEYPNLFLFS